MGLVLPQSRNLGYVKGFRHKKRTGNEQNDTIQLAKIFGVSVPKELRYIFFFDSFVSYSYWETFRM